MIQKIRQYARGFTLIELLVVIAIIGILSSVVLASLNTARAKGTDAKIESELHSIQTSANIYYDNNGSSYGPDAANCSTGMFAATNPNIAQVLTDLTNATAAADPVCNASVSANAFAVEHQLTADATKYFCIDSSGKAEVTTTAITTETTCP